MILVDSSVWVDHLRRGSPPLRALLDQDDVATHAFVIGELACGRIARRAEFFGLLGALPRLESATDAEVLALIERAGLAGQGLGWIDVHLLAACRLEQVSLWTSDRSLAVAAERLGVGAAR